MKSQCEIQLDFNSDASNFDWSLLCAQLFGDVTAPRAIVTREAEFPVGGGGLEKVPKQGLLSA